MDRPSAARPLGRACQRIGNDRQRQAGQLVTIQLRVCDQPTWQDVGEATTTNNGSWSVDFLTRISGLLRATSGVATTDAVQLQQRPYVFSHSAGQGGSGRVCRRRGSTGTGGLRISTAPAALAWWVMVKRVLLTETAAGGTGGQVGHREHDRRIPSQCPEGHEPESRLAHRGREAVLHRRRQPDRCQAVRDALYPLRRKCVSIHVFDGKARLR